MLIDRRTLLKSWHAIAAAVAALSALPAGLFFAAGAKRRGASSASTGGSWIDLGSAADVTGPWRVRTFRREIEDSWKKSVVEESVYVRRNGEAIEAVSAVCTHTGCLVQRLNQGFACPCHRSDFDEEGKPLSGPAPRPLDRLETKVEGEKLMLRFVKFRPGLSNSEPMAS
jgi:menaquinol-cytochrome c reductase iron-sulfur subunit